MAIESITLIIPIRDRDPWRLEGLIDSVRRNGSDPRVLIVDYGSDRVHSEQYLAIARALGADYERMETEGKPWNKCHAINRGVRAAESEFVCAVDVDVLFTSDPFDHCLRRYEGKEMYNIETYWLDEGGDRRKARHAGVGSPGMFQLIRRQAYFEAGGYDERIVYWGQEDLDWPERLKLLGYRQVWLPEPHRIYHRWHKSPEEGFLRPATATYDTMRRCIANKANPVLEQDWGRAVGKADRPILELIENGEPEVVAFEKNALLVYGNQMRLFELNRPGGFAKLELGQRIVHRPFSRAARAAKAMLRPLTALAGLDCSEKLNLNFDFAFAALPVLLENGLKDYYISKDVSELYLYWGDASS